MRLANLMVAFAGIAFFGQVLGLFAFIGKVGYEQGWWGGDLGTVSVAVALSVVVSAVCVRACVRWFG
jgi:hypothetical protein